MNETLREASEISHKMTQIIDVMLLMEDKQKQFRKEFANYIVYGKEPNIRLLREIYKLFQDDIRLLQERIKHNGS